MLKNIPTPFLCASSPKGKFYISTLFTLLIFLFLVTHDAKASDQKGMTSWPPQQTGKTVPVVSSGSVTGKAQLSTAGDASNPRPPSEVVTQSPSQVTNEGMRQGNNQASSQSVTSSPDTSSGTQGALGTDTGRGESRSPGRTIFRDTPATGGSTVPVITPSTALKDAAPGASNGTLSFDETKPISSWSGNATRALIRYVEPNPKPRDDSLPSLRPLGRPSGDEASSSRPFSGETAPRGTGLMDNTESRPPEQAGGAW